jgi:hypothetical protein
MNRNGQACVVGMTRGCPDWSRCFAPPLRRPGCRAGWRGDGRVRVAEERLIAERKLLQPLPSLRLQIGTPSVLRKVDRLSCMRYGSARYSVPAG